jgi:2-methylcitrate dehydratase PrpD
MTTEAMKLARWVHRLRFHDLSPAVIADAKLRVLDILGLAIAAMRTPIGRTVRAGVAQLGGGVRAARVLGYGEFDSAANAALVNGTLAHAEDFDDTHPSSIMHPSVVVVPTALAVAEAQRCDGRALLLAVALGNELACRLGDVDPGAFHRHGFHPTSVLGVLAAALTAGRLMGASEPQLVAATGIAASQGSGVLEAYADGTWSKTLHAGWAAHAGIVAATLARAGFTGPASALEGRFGIYAAFLHQRPERWRALTAGLGRRWHMFDVAFKPYPCAHAIHGYVDAALKLRHEHGLEASDIARIMAPVKPAYAPMIAEPRPAKVAPRTPTHARASLPYAIAAALVLGHLSPAAFAPRAIADPRIRALARRIVTPSDKEPVQADRFKGWLIVARRNGKPLEAIIAASRGSPANPMTRADVLAKFRANAGPALPARRIEAIIAAVDALDRASDVAALTKLCAVPRA